MTKFELPEKPKKTNTSEDFYNLRKAVDELDKFDYTWKKYANKADRRINAANKYIEELERENQRLIAENLGVKTLVDNARPQQALPVVPEFVAEWIERLKTNDLKPLKNPETYGETGFTEEKLQNIVFWISEHQEDYMRAWLDGYQVEKPQLFYIELPNVYGLKNKIFVSKVENGTIVEFSNGKNYALKFTEQEIKSIDERYWQFAVPVEDGE